MIFSCDLVYHVLLSRSLEVFKFHIYAISKTVVIYSCIPISMLSISQKMCTFEESIATCKKCLFSELVFGSIVWNTAKKFYLSFGVAGSLSSVCCKKQRKTINGAWELYVCKLSLILTLSAFNLYKVSNEDTKLSA